MIHAKNEEELLKILKIISGEAVMLAKKSLNESKDPYVSQYESQYASDEGIYGNLDEAEEDPTEDEEEDDDIEADADPSAEGEKTSDEPKEDMPKAPESSKTTEDNGFGVSFDSVMSAINSLRAGRSFKDQTIKSQASAYYDRLSEDERKILLLFLGELSKILSGAVQGSDASDPSDPPLNFDISTGEEKEDQKASDAEKVTAEPESQQPAPEDQEDAAEEDTSPPIKVNEQQDIDNLRRKVRRMMLRG